MLTQFTVPYGKTTITFNLSEGRTATLIAPRKTAPATDPRQVVSRALDEPIGEGCLSNSSSVQSAAIAINDKTRPVPHKQLLPPLLQRLEAMGLPPEAIKLIIATGTHPPMPPEEFGQVVPPAILARYPVICHDADDKVNLVRLGQTERGTPVWLNRHFVEADLRLVVGNIEPHQFMGFSGGVKSAVIGLAGKDTINHNHAMMLDPEARLGEYDRNPARQDVEEMGCMIDIHFALNAILNDSKEIIRILAGTPQAVMAQGIPLARQIYQIPVAEPFDLMIVSPGGHPKDINIYQTQKGLAHAALVTKTGGTIILVAACPEGTGSTSYERWMADKKDFNDVFQQFEAEGFRVGPHKAFQIARDASRIRVLLLSEMEPGFVRRLLLTPIDNIDFALSATLADLPVRARIGVMPLANATIPTLEP